MYKTFRTEIILSSQQQEKFFKTREACRFIYNLFIIQNEEWYKQGKNFMSAKSFSVWLNNEYFPNHEDKLWVKDGYSKAIKKSLENANKAYVNFFSGKTKFPKLKLRGKNDPKMYFVKNHETDCICERHRIKIPSLSWVKLKEKGYIPTTENGYIIQSGTIDYIAGKFYVSVLIKMPDRINKMINTNDGIGIDLGVKDFAILSNGTVYKNINKTDRVKKLEIKLKREQKKLSRKEYQSKNSQKQKIKIQKIYKQLTDIRNNYINEIISEIINLHPAYITIENLNIKGMMKNRNLSKAVQQQNFYKFRSILTRKCKENNIELRIVDRWFPSSKICNCCGQIKIDLKLSDRIYKCDCGYIADRDLNASCNLRDATIYEIA